MTATSREPEYRLPVFKPKQTAEVPYDQDT